MQTSYQETVVDSQPVVIVERVGRRAGRKISYSRSPSAEHVGTIDKAKMMAANVSNKIHEHKLKKSMSKERAARGSASSSPDVAGGYKRSEAIMAAATGVAAIAKDQMARHKERKIMKELGGNSVITQETIVTQPGMINTAQPMAHTETLKEIAMQKVLETKLAMEQRYGRDHKEQMKTLLKGAATELIAHQLTKPKTTDETETKEGGIKGMIKSLLHHKEHQFEIIEAAVKVKRHTLGGYHDEGHHTTLKIDREMLYSKGLISKGDKLKALLGMRDDKRFSLDRIVDDSVKLQIKESLGLRPKDGIKLEYISEFSSPAHSGNEEVVTTQVTEVIQTQPVIQNTVETVTYTENPTSYVTNPSSDIVLTKSEVFTEAQHKGVLTKLKEKLTHRQDIHDKGVVITETTELGR